MLRMDAPAVADTSVAAPAEVIRLPADARRAVWTEGVATVRRLTGKPDGAARSLVGKLIAAAGGENCAAALAAIRECPDTRDPVAWMMAAARQRGRNARNTMDAIRDDWDLPTLADTSLLDDEPRRGAIR